MNPTGLAALLKRIQVLASSSLTYLTAISAVLVTLAQQLDGVAGVPEWLTRVVASAIAVVAVVILQVRRVTPVADADKGLLPPKGPAVPAPAQPAQPDVGAVNVSTLLTVLALVCFVVFSLIAHGTFTSDEGFTWLGGGLCFWVAASFAP